MKLLTTIQIKELDRYTLEEENIPSINLMERASKAITEAVIRLFPDIHYVKVFAGPGNNGGDALAVARMLLERGCNVEVYLFNTTGKLSEDCMTNRDRLSTCSGEIRFVEVVSQFTPPVLHKDDIIIDGLFGSGLNKPLSGGFASVVKYINSSPGTVVSIDMPSGLMCEDNTYNNYNHIIKANVTLTLQLPKIAFLLTENQEYIGEWMCLDIQLSRKGLEETSSDYYITRYEYIHSILHKRKEFAHKGVFGHGLLIAGSYGMAGASILAAKAALRSGIGLITVHAPLRNNIILQTAVPEAMVRHDKNDMFFTSTVENDMYEATAIGPGLGQREETAHALLQQLRQSIAPLILDADALNILGRHRDWLSLVPQDSILTPHPKELERLVGRCASSYERLMKARELAGKYHIYILLKGAWSVVIFPDGTCHFNPTGNPGMATAGSGDVLTGILLSLLAQGYSSHETAILGAYLHGVAGDIAASKRGENGMIASDIVENIPRAWTDLEKNKYLCSIKEQKCL